MATLKAHHREGNQPAETFSVIRQEKQKAERILPRMSLTIPEHSFQEFWRSHIKNGMTLTKVQKFQNPCCHREMRGNQEPK